MLRGRWRNVALCAFAFFSLSFCEPLIASKHFQDVAELDLALRDLGLDGVDEQFLQKTESPRIEKRSELACGFAV
jgi:hypothetical protein